MEPSGAEEVALNTVCISRTHNMFIDGRISPYATVYFGNDLPVRHIDLLYDVEWARRLFLGFLVSLSLQYVLCLVSLPFQVIDNRPRISVAVDVFSMINVCYIYISYNQYNTNRTSFQYLQYYFLSTR